RKPRSIHGPHRPTRKERICSSTARLRQKGYSGAKLGPGQWKRVSACPIRSRKGSDTADRVKSIGEGMLEGDNARASMECTMSRSCYTVIEVSKKIKVGGVEEHCISPCGLVHCCACTL
ncbi:hypothetical protein C8A03DRAFT_19018, partial [Achaetomium macrosporum]